MVDLVILRTEEVGLVGGGHGGLRYCGIGLFFMRDGAATAVHEHPP